MTFLTGVTALLTVPFTNGSRITAKDYFLKAGYNQLETHLIKRHLHKYSEDGGLLLLVEGQT